jgi:phage gpG-like protein
MDILKTAAGNPTGLFFDIEWSGDVAQRLISASVRMQNFGPLLRAIGAKVVHSQQLNIMEGRSPSGQRFAPLKKPRGRGHNPGDTPLYDSGKLYDSIAFELEATDSVAIGFSHDAFYGRFQNLRTARIPQREFVGIRDGDLPEFLDLTHAHVQEAFEAA